MKEGAATFFEYLGVDLVSKAIFNRRGLILNRSIHKLIQIHPEWQMMDYFVVDVTQYVFFSDSNELAQPMTFYVEHPTDIDFNFNNIATSKGLCTSIIFSTIQSN